MTPQVASLATAARRAGDALARAFGRPDLLEVREKAASDFVTSADLASQAILREELSSAFPGCALVLEESEDRVAAASEARLIVDPLDGTTNFLHGIPHFAVSIALELHGAVEAGVVLCPPTGELFHAERGGGAWLGDQRLRVSRAGDPGRALIGTGIPHRGGRHHAAYLAALSNLAGEVAGVRRMGAAALDLAFVAAGRFEAFFELGLAPWDVAAGSLLVREAGGTVTRVDGGASGLGDSDILACGSEAMQGFMVERLAPIHARR